MNMNSMDPEAMRLQLLSNPQLMESLRHQFPEMADAAENDPPRFTQMITQAWRQREEATATQVCTIEAVCSLKLML